MKTSGGALAWLSGWIASAAAGFASIAGSVRSQRELRFVEDDDGLFTLMKKLPGSGWAGIGAAMKLQDAANIAPLPSELSSLLVGAKLDVVLQRRHFVVRSVELPAAAIRFIDGVLRAQIDRLTPWAASEAVFGSTAPERLDHDKIVVRLVAAARSHISTVVPAANALGVNVLSVLTSLEEGVQGSEVRVCTESPGAGVRIYRLRKWLAIGLVIALIAFALAGTAWLTVGADLDSQRADLENAVAQRRATLLAPGSGGPAGDVGALNERKRAGLPSVLALEYLSQALPDGTYLTNLHIEGGKLQISGVTDDAPRLIGLIEQSRRFSHATFFEPTTHAPNESGDRFHVEARIEPNWVATP